MKQSYGVIIAAVAVVVGYVVGISQGRSDESDSWQRAVASTDQSCRYAVRDALKTGPFLKNAE